MRLKRRRNALPNLLSSTQKSVVLSELLNQLHELPLPERRPTKLILVDFAQNTSCHGIPHIESSRTRFRRFFWALVFFTCVILFGIQFFLMITKFLRFDKIVDIQIKFEQIAFPAVTVCNLNPLKKSAIDKAGGPLQKQLEIYESAMAHISTAPSGTADDSSKERGRRAVTQSFDNFSDIHNETDGYEDDDTANTDDSNNNNTVDDTNELYNLHKTTPIPSSTSAARVKRERLATAAADSNATNNSDIPVDIPAGQFGRYQPVRTLCDCDIELFCEPISPQTMKEFELGTRWRSMCICFYDATWHSRWPCYLAQQWEVRHCASCQEMGYCPYGESVEIVQDAPPPAGYVPCACRGASELCLVRPMSISVDTEIVNIVPADVQQKSVTSSTFPWSSDKEKAKKPKKFKRPKPKPVSPHILSNLGYADIHDKATMNAKGKENLIFTVQEMSPEARANLSYSREEQIKQCSFAGKDCTISDFHLHQDAAFGNCYTFNYNPHSPMSASRPGSLYGLRVLWYVNRDEFLPTTEASGVKIAVHNQTEYPFPDTFGHNAPTGFRSSFAVKKQLIQRMSKPYGDCLRENDFNPTEMDPPYLYGTAYTMEGCHRMCVQKNLIDTCGCADPRFLAPEGVDTCRANDSTGRNCLYNISEEIIAAGSQVCQCAQPCTQTLFTVTFSTSQWPTEAAKANVCDNGEDCIEDYKENAAFLEVYFEQVNYQVLEESEAYGWVNLLADFGGNISLWLGISVITFIEFMVLIYELITSWYLTRRDGKVPRKDSSIFMFPLNNGPEPLDSRLYPPGWPTDHVDMNVTLNLEDEDELMDIPSPTSQNKANEMQDDRNLDKSDDVSIHDPSNEERTTSNSLTHKPRSYPKLVKEDSQMSEENFTFSAPLASKPTPKLAAQASQLDSFDVEGSPPKDTRRSIPDDSDAKDTRRSIPDDSDASRHSSKPRELSAQPYALARRKSSAIPMVISLDNFTGLSNFEKSSSEEPQTLANPPPPYVPFSNADSLNQSDSDSTSNQNEEENMQRRKSKSKSPNSSEEASAESEVYVLRRGKIVKARSDA